jgi:hypothetical protein
MTQRSAHIRAGRPDWTALATRSQSARSCGM